MFLKATTPQENNQAIPLSKIINFTYIYSIISQIEFNNYELLSKHHSINKFQENIIKES
jgi:hypothetical protein